MNQVSLRQPPIFAIMPRLSWDMQMLKSLTIENFKAWRNVDLEFAPVTGFFGTNSSGKSSLIQFLLMLKQTRNATDRRIILDFGGESGIVNLGTYKDVIHNQDATNFMSWSLKWSLPEPLEIRNPAGTKGDILFRGELLKTGCYIGGMPRGLLFPYELFYKFDDTDFRLKHIKESVRNKFELSTDSSKFEFKRNVGRAWKLPSPIKTHLFPDETRYFFQNAEFLGEFEFAYEEFMDSIYYLGPLREHPKREYQWTGTGRSDVGKRGEFAIDAILAATRDEEKRSLGFRKWRMDFQKMIAYWLLQLGLVEDFQIEEIKEGSNLYRALVKMPGSNVRVTLTDVGFGVSQILPVLVLLYYVPEGSTVLMEQPEIHLHPAVQSGLADLMLNVAEARKLQIILESHSEHLLRRFQRRVAEGKASSKNIKLYFVSTKGGVAKVDDLNLNEWGEIEKWPDNFFGDEMGEIAAIAESSINRKLEIS